MGGNTVPDLAPTQREGRDCPSWSFWRGPSAEGPCVGHRQLLPSSGLPLAAAPSGADRRCLSHAVVLSGEPVFVLFLTSVLSLDLSCCFPQNELQLVSVEDFHGRPTIYHTTYGELSE